MEIDEIGKLAVRQKYNRIDSYSIALAYEEVCEDFRLIKSAAMVFENAWQYRKRFRDGDQYA
jgi:hypothetical protein